MNIISVKNLSKYYNNFCAIDNISFDIRKGEIFGFLGPNGAGKTTTVRILTTILRPSSGNISIGNLDLLKNSLKIRQVIGFVPETANVYPDLSAIQNLNLMCDLYNVSKEIRTQNIEKLLVEFELYDKKNLKTKKFSKGMKQRLILCMALVHNPQILFLDEPTSGLDVQSSRVIKRLIKEYNKQGITIFLTTHNMDVANELCDRIAILNKGRIIALDTPENLKNIFKKGQTIEIAFNRNIPISSLQNLSQIDNVIKMEDYFNLFIKNPTESIYELLDFIQNNNLELKRLNLDSPKLEDIFLKIIEVKD